MILFGGSNIATDPYQPNMFYRDCWRLSLDSLAWAPLVTLGTPPAQAPRHVGVLDARRRRMLVFAPGEPVHQLSLDGAPAWSVAYPELGPGTRLSGMSYVLDTARDRVLLFGGEEGYPAPYSRALLALDLSSGVLSGPLLTEGYLDVGTAFHAVAYQPKRDRMVVFGGGSWYSGLTVLDQTAFLTGDQPTPAQASLALGEWTAHRVRLRWSLPDRTVATLAVERSDDGASWIVVAEGVSASQGEFEFVDDAVQPGRAYRYRLSSAGQVLDEVHGETPAAAVLFALEGVQPSIVNHAAHARLALPRRSQVRWEVFDVAGRTCLGGEWGELEAGRHVRSLPGVERLGNGAFWLRMSAGSWTDTRRFVVRR